MNILLEYLLVFVVVFVINYFMIIVKNGKYNKKTLPPELVYLKRIYKININKSDYKGMIYSCCVINTFIISTLYIILMYLLDSWILRIIFGIVLLILLIIICYGLLGRYYKSRED